MWAFQMASYFLFLMPSLCFVSYMGKAYVDTGPPQAWEKEIEDSTPAFLGFYL